ncbi:hypothetical protein NC651_031287 [Populus alba x Populus x berolinensis]|nr:hypothetical protein NC651_031287 [Populus alba x Populus x berolinensis]
MSSSDDDRSLCCVICLYRCNNSKLRAVMMRGGRRMAMEGGDIKKQPWPTFPSLSSDEASFPSKRNQVDKEIRQELGHQAVVLVTCLWTPQSTNDIHTAV